jgi:hypothetical protein
MSEKTYRMLGKDEIMREGDEWKNEPGPWFPVVGLAGKRVSWGVKGFQARRHVETTLPTLIANDVDLLSRLIEDQLQRAGNDTGYIRTLLRILDTMRDAKNDEVTEIKIYRTPEED